jgi:cyclic-di-AMP phosphodiesterase PgpH
LPSFFKKFWNPLRSAFTRSFSALSRHFEGRAENEIAAPERLYRRKQWAHYFYGLVFAAAFALVIVAPGPDSVELPMLNAGDVATTTLRSPITARVEPRDLPKSERDAMTRKVSPVFDYDDRAIPNWLQKWEKVFETLQAQTKLAKGIGGKTAQALEIDRISQNIEQITGQSLPREDLIWLHQHRFNENIQKTFSALGKPLIGRLVSTEDLFPTYYGTGIVIRQIQLGLNEALIQDVSRIWSLDHARQLVGHMLATLPKHQTEEKQRVAHIVKQLVIPNLVYNAAMTQKRLESLLAERRAPAKRIERGEILIQRGERVTEAQKELIATLVYLTSWKSRGYQFFLIFLSLSVLVSVLFRLELGRKSFWKLTLKNALVLLFVSIGTLVAVKFSVPQLAKFLMRFQIDSGAEYLVPVAAGGMILHLVLGKEIAYTFALMISFACGFWLDQKFSFGLWMFVTTATAIQTIGACKLRTDIYKSGLLSGKAGALLVLSFSLLEYFGKQRVDWTLVLVLVGFAVLSGLLAAILTSSIIPVMEWLFGYTTSLKLLELSNFNHPLLHNLMMKAPGTYHHSVIAGSLAEIAADRVKANPLLARVAAYYHDIGKMTKPLYFIENQPPNHNPHDGLSPTISAKILFAHVKIGVRMAEEHNLGEDITGIIEQHHGTTLISYFFNRAKDHSKDGHDHAQESDFRYPGPKPQTREAAIVMLADSCEAATRSISEPTPAKIQNMVRNIINNRFLEEQFSDCDLTLNDLKIIEECFVRTLVSIYHNRIEYPGQKEAVSNS